MISFLSKEYKGFNLYSWLIILFAIVASVQSYLLPGKEIYGDGVIYPEYNNYVIFKYSFFHLIENKNLFVLYKDEYFDLYKYSPTFAMFMGLFAYLPDWLGLSIWNILNAVVLITGIQKLKLSDPKKNLFFLMIITIELITNLQNAQSNALLVGLILWAFHFLETKKVQWAALMVLLSAFIKIFGLVAFCFFIFYPNKWRSALYSILWTILLFFLPLILIDWNSLMDQYINWSVLLSEDHSQSVGLSVMGWLETWFGYEGSKNAVLLAGILFLLAPLVRYKNYRSLKFRQLYLAALLIWMVIFNHKAESPTFIIAITGVALFFLVENRSYVNTSLFILAFVLTSLSPTDLFPRSLREDYVIPYVLKAVPCILIWIKITFDLLRRKNFPI